MEVNIAGEQFCFVFPVNPRRANMASSFLSITLPGLLKYTAPSFTERTCFHHFFFLPSSDYSKEFWPRVPGTLNVAAAGP